MPVRFKYAHITDIQNAWLHPWGICVRFLFREKVAMTVQKLCRKFIDWSGLVWMESLNCWDKAPFSIFPSILKLIDSKFKFIAETPFQAENYNVTCMKQHSMKRSHCFRRSVFNVAGFLPLSHCNFTSFKPLCSTFTGSSPLMNGHLKLDHSFKTKNNNSRKI